jgi:hypothetical protein
VAHSCRSIVYLLGSTVVAVVARHLRHRHRHRYCTPRDKLL